ncbi:asparagine synthase (glutamine-hydrolyzing) [Lentisalinibacter sediminis]|uniref:asparagine synthase (glutamine-hydrolyzing) n=1 Tax=Lentisalinibacter sediminis TaxID=2992237 RepID=UPI00386E3D65
MCGISGVLTHDPAISGEQLLSVVTAMRAGIAHRGPDDEGTWIDTSNGIGFAHTRLAILDLTDAGHQPMHSAKGRFCITYNGEIYNFRTLRSELTKLGFRPIGSSDTEIVLAAIEEWGVHTTLSKLTGMFAIAIWDKKEKVLHLARDRMGEKPLYYGFLDGSFVFASELKALKRHPKWSQSIDRDALTLFMRYAYIPAPYSIFDRVFKLMPGCILSIPSDVCLETTQHSPWPDAPMTPLQQRQYWDLKCVAESGLDSPIADPNSAITQLESLLLSVISDQMVSDVPLGAFLSGGIDSSTVVALMQSMSCRPVRTFTIGFDALGFDESEHAARVAAHIGTDHTELFLTGKEAMDVIPLLPKIYDEPHADASDIPAVLVSRLARENVTVAMSGDGGDELFCGYNRYLHSNRIWNAARLVPQSLRRTLSAGIKSLSPSQWDQVSKLIPGHLPRTGYKLHRLADAIEANGIDDVYKRLISYWLDPSSLVLSSKEPPSFFRDNNRLGRDANFIDQMLFWDQLAYLPDDNLTKMDRASMSVGLETRAPLLDHRIVSFAWSIDQHMKVRNGSSKWLLRKVLYNHVPRDIIDRPKMGFSVPIGEWLRGPLKDWASDLLDSSTLRRQSFLDVDLVTEEWQAHQSGRRDLQNSLWSVLTFQAWLQDNNVW